MKKDLYFLSVVLIALPILVLGQTGAVPPSTSVVGQAQAIASSPSLFPEPLEKGDQGNNVMYLQQILKSSPQVYPEGLVTGYYGSLTEEAVKRLQKNYGLSATGIVDEGTQAIIFPRNVQLVIIAPNGGESWDKSETRSILWKSTVGPLDAATPGATPQSSAGESRAGVSTPGATSIMPVPSPFFPNVSIDLVRDSDVSFSYHIGAANLYDSQYSWRIASEIPNGDDYRVRISIGGDVPCLMESEKFRDSSRPWPCPLMGSGAVSNAYPWYSTSKTSDNPFKITGTGFPSTDFILKLKTLVSQMDISLGQLINQLNSLKALLQEVR